MSKLFQYAGIAASVVLIAFGIGAIYMGIDGRDRVRNDLAASRSSAPPTPPSPTRRSTPASEAQAFAKVIRKHTLEATGGQTYAQMGRSTSTPTARRTNDKAAAAIDPKTRKPGRERPRATSGSPRPR